MNSKETEKVLTIFLEGRLDNNNADQVKSEIEAIRSQAGGKKLVLDMDELEYISSAGLRAVLTLQKENSGGVEIINANRDVYDLFEMTGFNTVIPVKRGLRKFSLDDLELVGIGPNAVTYRFDDETTIKVFSDQDVTKEEVEADRQKAQKAFLKGIPTAIPFDVVDVEGSLGIVYEMVNSGTLLKLLLDRPEKIGEIGRRFGAFMNSLHQIDMGSEDDEVFMDQKRIWMRALGKLENEFDPNDFFKIKMIIGKIPLMNNFSHGDFSPGNVFIRDDQFMLMDMMMVGKGNPIFDLVGLYNFSVLPITIKGTEDSKKLTKEQGEEFFDNALKGYFDTDDEEFLGRVKSMVAILAPLRDYLLLNYFYDPESNPEVKKEVDRFKEMVVDNLGVKLSEMPYNIF